MRRGRPAASQLAYQGGPWWALKAFMQLKHRQFAIFREMCADSVAMPAGYKDGSMDS